MGLRGLLPLAAILVLVLVLGAGSAGAVPPSGVTVSQDHGRATVDWTNPEGTTEIQLLFSHKPFRSAAFGKVTLLPPLSSWSGTTPLPPGTYYVFVGTISCESCLYEWAPPAKFVVPQWTIQAGRAIANVTVGMPYADVNLFIGKYHDTRWSSTTNYTQYSYNGKGLYFSFLGDLNKYKVVHHMGATSPKYYVEGTRIHTTSTEKALHAAFPKVKCRNFLFINLMERDCTLGRRAKGSVVTVFYVWKGRISSIAIGRLRFLKGDAFYGQNGG